MGLFIDHQERPNQEVKRASSPLGRRGRASHADLGGRTYTGARVRKTTLRSRAHRAGVSPPPLSPPPITGIDSAQSINGDSNIT